VNDKPRECIVLILFVFILVALSPFGGVYFHIPRNYSSLIVYVVDFEGRVDPYQGGTLSVGPMMVQSTEQMAKSEAPHLGYIIISVEI